MSWFTISPDGSMLEHHQDGKFTLHLRPLPKPPAEEAFVCRVCAKKVTVWKTAEQTSSGRFQWDSMDNTELQVCWACMWPDSRRRLRGFGFAKDHDAWLFVRRTGKKDQWRQALILERVITALEIEAGVRKPDRSLILQTSREGSSTTSQTSGPDESRTPTRGLEHNSAGNF